VAELGQRRLALGETTAEFGDAFGDRLACVGAGLLALQRQDLAASAGP
jgi:hypothetical protein